MRLLIAAFVLSSLCRADIIINLTSPQLQAMPGSVVTFSGTLTNIAASTAFLNSAGLNLSGGFAPGDLDAGPFFVNAPLFLAAGGATGTIDLFTINVPAAFPNGLYAGEFTVLGGIDDTAQDLLGSANFSVQVTAIPEPSTFVLLAISAAVIAVRHLHTRNRTDRE